MKFNAVNNKEGGYLLSVSGQCGGSSAVSLACIISMCFVQRFLGGLSLCFGLWIILFILYPHPSSPFIFPLINECNRCLVPLPGVGAHGWKARIYQGLACSRRSVSRVRCSDGGERVNRTRRKRGEKTRGEWGEFPPSSLSSLSPFSFLVKFSTALYYLNAWNRLTRG